MKKVLSLCICLLLCFALLPSCAAQQTTDLSGLMGLSFTELCQQISEEEPFVTALSDMLYVFFTDEQGNICAAGLSSADGVYTVVDCQCYTNSGKTSNKAFNSLKPGMTILEVVEIVGIPIGTATSGMYTLVFQGKAGYYVIYFDTVTGTVTEIKSPVADDPSFK